jgi:hypothetical protein
MAYGVIIPVAIAATNVDSYNRSAISASIVENGSPVALLTKSTTTGQAEVWDATTPATANLMSNWIAYDPELVYTSSYRGLDPDVRNFRIPIGNTFSVFKPQVGDLLLMSEDCFSGAKSTATYAASADGQAQFVWTATSQSASCVALHYIATQYISIGTGAIDTQRVTAYLMEVIPQT